MAVGEYMKCIKCMCGRALHTVQQPCMWTSSDSS